MDLGPKEFDTSDPAIDVASLNGIESLFRKSVKDPWASRLAGSLAEMFIYADRIAYMQPVGKDDPPEQRPGAPHPVIAALQARDTGVFHASTYSTDPPLPVDDAIVEQSFDRFSAWALNNATGIRGWLKVQRQPWIRTIKRSAGRHVFDLESLESETKFERLAQQLKETPRALVHLFDVNIRIPYYVKLRGNETVLAHHPVRSACFLPSMEIERPLMRVPAISFKDVISKMAPGLTRDEFAVLLHELRGKARELKLGLLGPGEVEKEQIRHLCVDVGLPPRVKPELLKWLGRVSSPVPVLGTIVSVLMDVWSGELPRTAASPRLRWLHPYLEWDLEKQATA